MARGKSLHIGLNNIDPEHYGGDDGTLAGCEFDARDMTAIADARGFESSSLLTADATADAVIAAIGQAANELAEGDTYLVTYSGHGGQVPDLNGDDEEQDRYDETWALYDRQLVDDELYQLWSGFKPGVKIAVFSDSCHSGSVVKALASIQPQALEREIGPSQDFGRRMKALPVSVERATYEAHQALYDGIQKDTPPLRSADVDASALLISGCQDNQTSADGDRNGLFTQQLRRVWDDGRFRGGYRDFHKRIVEQMPPWQVPNIMSVGAPSRPFERETPFSH